MRVQAPFFKFFFFPLIFYDSCTIQGTAHFSGKTSFRQLQFFPISRPDARQHKTVLAKICFQPETAPQWLTVWSKLCVLQWTKSLEKNRELRPDARLLLTLTAPICISAKVNNLRVKGIVGHIFLNISARRRLSTKNMHTLKKIFTAVLFVKMRKFKNKKKFLSLILFQIGETVLLKKNDNSAEKHLELFCLLWSYKRLNPGVRDASSRKAAAVAERVAWRRAASSAAYNFSINQM